MSAFALQPAPNFRLLMLQRCAHNSLGCLSVGVGRCRGDSPLAFQTLPKLLVAAAYVFLQGVTPGFLVLREIVRTIGGTLNTAGDGGLIRLVWRCLAGAGHQKQQPQNR